MERWFGIVALLLIAGLLAGLLVVLVGLKDEGVAIRLSGPIAIEGPTGPQEIHVVLEVPEGIQVEAGGEAEASLHTTLEGIPLSELPRRVDGACALEPVHRGDHLEVPGLRPHDRGSLIPLATIGPHISHLPSPVEEEPKKWREAGQPRQGSRYRGHSGQYAPQGERPPRSLGMRGSIPAGNTGRSVTYRAARTRPNVAWGFSATAWSHHWCSPDR